MAKLTLEIPDPLLSQLEAMGKPLQSIVLQAVEQYIDRQTNLPISQTQTWQLAGSLKVVHPEPEFIVAQDQQGQPITNYAEGIDQVLY